MCIRDLPPNSCGWGKDSLFVGGFNLLTRAKQAFGMQEPKLGMDLPTHYSTPSAEFAGKV